MLNQFFPNLIGLQASFRRLEVFIKKSNLIKTILPSGDVPTDKIRVRLLKGFTLRFYVKTFEHVDTYHSFYKNIA
jgi:hypothetical protein